MGLPESARLDVYLTLLAIGWIDGHLDDRERTLILRAARQDGLSDDDFERLEEAAAWPVSFEDLVPELPTDERRYVYTLASAITRLDGEVDPVEEAALDAFAEVLRVDGPGRVALDLHASCPCLRDSKRASKSRKWEDGRSQKILAKSRDLAKQSFQLEATYRNEPLKVISLLRTAPLLQSRTGDFCSRCKVGRWLQSGWCTLRNPH
jgi:uncharacterized tellurite resistance protein B-like protein